MTHRIQTPSPKHLPFLVVAVTAILLGPQACTFLMPQPSMCGKLCETPNECGPGYACEQGACTAFDCENFDAGTTVTSSSGVVASSSSGDSSSLSSGSSTSSASSSGSSSSRPSSSSSSTSSGSSSGTTSSSGVTSSSGPSDAGVQDANLPDAGPCGSAGSPTPVGSSCGAGFICDGLGACIEACYIGNFVIQPGLDFNNPCQACDPAQNTTAYTPLAGGAVCGSGDAGPDAGPATLICDGVGACAPGCFVVDTMYDPGPTTSNVCLACDPTLGTSALQNVAVGTPCDVDRICNGTGVCSLSCNIGGVVVPAGPDPVNPCFECDPAQSATSWVPRAEGASCGTGFVCDAAQSCVYACFINNAIVQAGDNPANFCEACAPATSTTAYTPKAGGTGCNATDICDGAGACLLGCFVNSTFYSPGLDPLNPCLECVPSTSTSALQEVAEGMPCGTGGGELCDGLGTCAPSCYIGGVLYPPDLNPADPCLECLPGASTTSWTPLQIGSGCGTGLICNAIQACVAGCYVGTTFYSAGPDPDNACRECVPLTTTSALQDVSIGSPCGSGLVCDGTGSCISGCFESNTLYRPGEDPANPCRTCIPGTSTTSLQNVGPGEPCAVEQICDGIGACVRACYIGTELVGPGLNATNACEECDPARSTSTYSPMPPASPCTDNDGCTTDACNGAGACISPAICTGTTPVCNLPGPTCTCSVSPSDSCAGQTNNKACVGGTCGCNLTTDCAAGFSCSGNTCVPCNTLTSCGLECGSCRATLGSPGEDEYYICANNTQPMAQACAPTACLATAANCNNVDTDQCEQDIAASAANCGACGVQCQGSNSCNNGMCKCQSTGCPLGQDCMPGNNCRCSNNAQCAAGYRCDLGTNRCVR